MTQKTVILIPIKNKEPLKLIAARLLALKMSHSNHQPAHQTSIHLISQLAHTLLATVNVPDYALWLRPSLNINQLYQKK